jgi:hypothetical protein
MLIGHVSDESYQALPDVMLEIETAAGSVAARSRASGAVYAEVPSGPAQVTLSKPGYGAKRVDVVVAEGQPFAFRLLSDRLLGYAWPKWARGGESAEYRVHSSEPYKLGLWRYGEHREFTRSFGWHDEHGPRTTVQITPDGDYTQTGVHWNRQGYGLRWHQQRVEAPSRSGLYFFEAKTASGDFFSFPWIVEPASPQADIAVLTSNLTWTAVNNFGGRSNYVNQAGLPERPTVNARQDLWRFTQPDTWPYQETAAALSFDRPEPFNFVPEGEVFTDPIEGRRAQPLAPGEWRLLGWLEREGFRYDLYSETSLHFGTLDLDQYRVLILNNHPEYWSKEMYYRVKRWVFERGGRLMYLGGCAFYAEVEFADADTVLCRREGRRELRQESAAKLLGIEYTHVGYKTAAPYRVIDDQHWVFTDVGLKRGDRFGFESLHEHCPGGASGHELDKLSANSPEHLHHLAKGENPDDTGADLVCFETPSGGVVFAAGSLCWPLSLPVDEGTSKVTANVVERLLR